MYVKIDTIVPTYNASTDTRSCEVAATMVDGSWCCSPTSSYVALVQSSCHCCVVVINWPIYDLSGVRSGGTHITSPVRQFCQITGTGNSAKSLAHSFFTYRQFCQITDTLSPAQSLTQAILPNHWHAPSHTGNSAKSLAKTNRQFCQITGTGNSAK
jgi:hypothetical protein